MRSTISSTCGSVARAATRFEKNTTAPFVKVRISGHEFDHVRAETAPEMAERVAAAMAAKSLE